MKRDFEIIKLHFSGPLHLSRGKSDYASSHEILHSDSLKSALFAAAQMVMDVSEGQISEKDNNQNDFLDSFKISSAFPFYNDECFFPKPKCEIQEVWDEGVKDRKGKKDIIFIGQSFFEDIITGKPISKIIEREKHVNQIEIFGNERFRGKFASERMRALEIGNPDFFILSEDNVMMRVVVPRHYENAEQNPRPYYVERMFFSEQGGLYFFVEFLNEKYRSKLETALEVLGESGIGTDRNVGNGQFTHEFSKLTLDLPENATHQMLLSLCCPSKDEATAISNATEGSTAYSLIKRGGYISSPEKDDNFMAFRKRSVYMLEEGSILPEGKTIGVLHDLRPNDVAIGHPIWRDGRAFTLPINPIWND